MKSPYLKIHFIYPYLNLNLDVKLRLILCNTEMANLNFYFLLDLVTNIGLTHHDNLIFFLVLFTNEKKNHTNITNNWSNRLDKTCRIKSGIAKASVFITAYQNRLSNANKLAYYLHNP